MTQALHEWNYGCSHNAFADYAALRQRGI